eukprot:g4439.t1
MVLKSTVYRTTMNVPTLVLLLLALLAGVTQGLNPCLERECVPGALDLELNGCGLGTDDIEDLDACFATVEETVISVDLEDNVLDFLPVDLFEGLDLVVQLYLQNNALTTLPAGLFDPLLNLATLTLGGNPDLQCIPASFASIVSPDPGPEGPCECDPASAVECLEGECVRGEYGYTCVMPTPSPTTVGTPSPTSPGLNPCLERECVPGALDLELNGCGLGTDDIEDLDACFATVEETVISVDLEDNVLDFLPVDLFEGLDLVVQLYLQNNALTTLPAGLFDPLLNLATLTLGGNPDLQCIPASFASIVSPDPGPEGPCECDPASAVECLEGECVRGEYGYTCEPNAPVLVEKN